MSRNKTKYTPTEAIAAVDGLHRKRLYEMMAAETLRMKSRIMAAGISG